MKISKKQIFYIFLIIHALVWTLVQFLRNIVSVDAMEAISWGELISLGTNKHPPLSGWIMAGIYNAIPYDFIIYLTGQLCIILGFIYIYKLAKYFITEEKAFCSVMILESCYYYSYYIFVNSYNCNVLLMGLWPVIIYYFYKSIKQNKLSDWLILGVTSALGFLAKYQIVFLLFGMLLYLIFTKKELFKKKEIYLAFSLFILCCLGHIIWLHNTDFFSFAYMLERTHSETHNLPYILVKISHLFYPVKFLTGQLIAVASCIFIYLLTAWQCGFEKDEKIKDDNWFLICMLVLPIILQGLVGAVTGNRIPSVWGTMMIGLTGICLFYYFPFKFKDNTFDFFTKLTYLSMLLSLLIVVVYGIAQEEFVIAYPHKKIMADFEKIWSKRTNNAPLKYVAGENPFIFRYYYPTHPTTILETFGAKNIWIDHKDVIKSGALIVSPKLERTVKLTKEAVYLLPDNYKIKPEKYTVEVCNKLGSCDEKTLYYVIIAPKE